jgi:hypothetical protein
LASEKDGQWQFRRTERLPHIETIEGKPNIVVDGVFFPVLPHGHCKGVEFSPSRMAGTDFARRLIVLDRHDDGPGAGHQLRLASQARLREPAADRRMLS